MPSILAFSMILLCDLPLLVQQLPQTTTPHNRSGVSDWKLLRQRAVALDQRAFDDVLRVRTEEAAIHLLRAAEKVATPEQTKSVSYLLIEALAVDLHVLHADFLPRRHPIQESVQRLLKQRKPQSANSEQRMAEFALLRFGRWLAVHQDHQLALQLVEQLSREPPQSWLPEDQHRWFYQLTRILEQLPPELLQHAAGQRLITRLNTLAKQWFPPSRFPAGHVVTVRLALCQARLARAQGDHDAEVRWYHRAIDAAEWAVENGLLCSLSLTELHFAVGQLFRDKVKQGAWKEAEPLARQLSQLSLESLQLDPQTPRHVVAYAAASRLYGKTLYMLDKFEQTASCLESAIKRIDSLPGNRTPTEQSFIAFMYADLAAAYSAMRRSSLAVDSLRTGFDRIIQLPDSHPDKPRCVVSISIARAFVCIVERLYSEAESAIATAQQFLDRFNTRIPDRRWYQLNVLVAEAKLAKLDGDWELTRVLLSRIDAMPVELNKAAVREPRLYVGILHLRAQESIARGDFKSARRTVKLFHEYSKELRDGLAKDRNRRRLDFLATECDLLLARGKWRESIRLLENARDSSSRQSMNERRNSWLEESKLLGEIWCALGRYDLALMEVAKSEEEARRRLAHGYGAVYQALVTLPALRGEILLASGRPKEAADCFMAVAEQEPYLFFEVGMRRSVDNVVRRLMYWERGTDLLLSVDEAAHLDPQEVYERILPYRGLMFRVLSHHSRLRSRELSHSDRELYDAYHRQRLKVAQLSFRRNLEMGEPGLDSELAVAEERRNSLELELRSSSLPLAVQERRVQSRYEQIRQSLRPGEVLLDFVEYCHHHWDPARPGIAGRTTEHRYRVYILCPDQPLQVVALGPCDAIDEAIDRWRTRVAAGDGVDCGLALAKLIWQPIFARIPRQTRRLLIAAAGKISLVSWAALPDSARGGQPLLVRYETIYLPFAGYLCRRQSDSPESSGGTILAVGDIDYGSSSGGKASPNRLFRAALENIGPLPATRHEIEVIQSLWPRDRLICLTGNEATVERVVGTVGRVEFIHLATHGIVASSQLLDRFNQAHRYQRWPHSLRYAPAARNPLSLVAMVMSRGDGDDLGTSILLAEHVAGLDLSHVRLVVLSACDSGRGPVLANEGVFSIHRAFLMAGARGTVSALWAVSDDATAELMSEFYTALRKNELTPSAALRRAQLRAAQVSPQFSARQIAQRGPRLSKRQRITLESPKFRPPRDWGGFFFSGLPPVSSSR